MEINLRHKRAKIVRVMLKQLFPKVSIALKYSNNFELLVAVVLSAQCTDKKVNEVTKKLFAKYKTIKEYANADIDLLAKDIYSTGFYKQKAKNIIKTAQIIHKVHNDKIPKTMEEILKLPGIARKSANVILGNAYGVIEGIAVDTHVKRLSLKFMLTDKSNPDKIEKDLMEIIPRKEWFIFTYRLIEYGRKYSPAYKRKNIDDPISKSLFMHKLI